MSEEETAKVNTRIALDSLQCDQPCLVVVSGFDLGRRYPLDYAETIIGRRVGADIYLKENNVSRNHARLIKEGGWFFIEDLESKNSTLVNGIKITHRQRLEDGDLIIVGKVILKFSIQSKVDRHFYDEIYSSKYDELTGLVGRKFFQKHLKLEFVRARRYSHSLSLLIMDVDDFKKVNDGNGHHVGDMVLNFVGKTIAHCVRKDVDVPARYGGEEFAVLLPEVPLDAAQIVAEKIRSRIEKLVINYNDHSLQVTISVGVSSNQEGIFSLEELVRKADEKLYMVKQSGKNRVEA
jgi:diguanylate cyclase (GGDEF)-like protein